MGAAAQTTDDVVIVSQRTDAYVFAMKNGKTEVHHSCRTDYRLNSQGAQTVQPFVHYGDDIRLDRASCSGLTAEYRNVTPDNVFFDDSKICFFTAELTTRRPRLSAEFQRTFTDLRYFARVPITTDRFTERLTLTFTIPHGMEGIRLVPVNFDGRDIQVEAMSTKTDSVFTFTMTNVPATPDDAHMPPLSLTAPCVLVMGAFSDYHELYRWSHELTQIDTDIPGIDQILTEIAAGAATADERLRNTYAWVQRNIRYVAFEAGIAGHQPDRPAEVVRKRYGDCKGMAMLLRTLLRAQGIDARLAIVGTRDIPFDMSRCPSLAASNHMICQARTDDHTYWLDATCRYIPADYVPQHIQSREAMVEDGDDCQMVRLPLLPAAASVDSLCYNFQLSADRRRLTGTAVYSLSGDMKEQFMSAYEHRSLDSKTNLLAGNLNADDHSKTVTDAVWRHRDAASPMAVFTGQVEDAHSLQQLDDEIYVELNPHNNLYAAKIDTLRRRSDFWLPSLCNVVREVRLQLPQDVALTHVPEPFSLSLPQGELSCSFDYRKDERLVVFCQRMHLTDRLIRRADIPAWNDALSKWLTASNEQIILKTSHQQ